ncbi:hypothetical protein B0H10DRAFT_659655 [Mycena sp. CBHHK59/15]|nr:hypothetical protein B0H10DRAFT_659655 [Mycena sp. CBHHK59/15]
MRAALPRTSVVFTVALCRPCHLRRHRMLVAQPRTQAAPRQHLLSVAALLRWHRFALRRRRAPATPPCILAARPQIPAAPHPTAPHPTAPPPTLARHRPRTPAALLRRRRGLALLPHRMGVAPRQCPVHLRPLVLVAPLLRIMFPRRCLARHRRCGRAVLHLSGRPRRSVGRVPLPAHHTRPQHHPALAARLCTAALPHPIQCRRRLQLPMLAAPHQCRIRHPLLALVAQRRPLRVPPALLRPRARLLLRARTQALRQLHILAVPHQHRCPTHPRPPVHQPLRQHRAPARIGVALRIGIAFQQ